VGKGLGHCVTGPCLTDVPFSEVGACLFAPYPRHGWSSGRTPVGAVEGLQRCDARIPVRFSPRLPSLVDQEREAGPRPRRIGCPPRTLVLLVLSSVCQNYYWRSFVNRTNRRCRQSWPGNLLPSLRSCRSLPQGADQVDQQAVNRGWTGSPGTLIMNEPVSTPPPASGVNDCTSGPPSQGLRVLEPSDEAARAATHGS
jgi:hypothetical protein